jgi:hypothetical protein
MNAGPRNGGAQGEGEMIEVFGYVVSGTYVWLVAYGHVLVVLACLSTPFSSSADGVRSAITGRP